MRIRLVHLPLDLPEQDAPRGAFVNIMPVGLLALADRLARDRHDVEVVHGGVEKRVHGAYDVAADLERRPVDLLGFALHWHHQLGPVASAVEAVRRAGHGLPVVLGGMTATAFARELIESWPGVDYVVRGEAEEPLAQLAIALASGAPDVARVPNLTRRVDGRTVSSPLGYVADQPRFDALEFCRLELLRNASHYNSQFAPDLDGFSHEPMFYLGIGRGCSVDCAFCAGGRTAHHTLAGRRDVIFRSHERVVEDLRKLLAHGIRTACICFDPPPTSEAYFLALFDRIRAAKLAMSMVFECYGTPSTAFVEAFDRTFDRRASRLSFSPTVGSERLRRRLLGHAYANAELERVLSDCARLGVPTTLYFATVPQESIDELEASLAWQRELVRRFGCRLIHAPIEMEPHAPWSTVPSSFGLTHARSGFADYSARHRTGTTLGVRYASELGYEFDDVDARVVRIQSAFVDTTVEVGRAMSTCGQRSPDRYLLAAPGRLAEALKLGSAFRARPVVVFVPEGERGVTDWSLLGEVAEALGPNARVASTPTVRHVSWDGRKVVRAPVGQGGPAVLHLRDGAAARAAFASRERLVSGDAVLAERCRWSKGACPALELRMMAVGADGAVRACLSCPPQRSRDAAGMQGDLSRLSREAQARRGCATCPVASTCAKCIFPGRVAEADYCDIRRSLGPEGPGSDTLASLRGESAPGAAIGWDE